MAGISGIGKMGNDPAGGITGCGGQGGATQGSAALEGKDVDQMAKEMGMDKQEFMKKYDKNGDGKISGKELEQLVQDLMKNEMEKAGMGGGQAGGGGQGQQAGPAGKPQGAQQPNCQGGQCPQSGPAEKPQGPPNNETSQDWKSMDFKEAAGDDNQISKEEASNIGMDSATFDNYAGADNQMNQQEFSQAQSGAAPVSGGGV